MAALIGSHQLGVAMRYLLVIESERIGVNLIRMVVGSVSMVGCLHVPKVVKIGDILKVNTVDK